MPAASEPVAVQTLPLFLPITSIFITGVSILVFAGLLWLGHRRHETGPVTIRLLIAVIIASLILQIGAPLNQVNLLPTDIWTEISIFARLVVMIGLIVLATLDVTIHAWLRRHLGGDR